MDAYQQQLAAWQKAYPYLGANAGAGYSPTLGDYEDAYRKFSDIWGRANPYTGARSNQTSANLWAEGNDAAAQNAVQSEQDSAAYEREMSKAYSPYLTPEQQAQWHQLKQADQDKKRRLGQMAFVGAAGAMAAPGLLGMLGAESGGLTAAGGALSGAEGATGGLGSFVFNPAVDSQLASSMLGITGADAAAAATIPAWAQGAAGAAWTGGLQGAGLGGFDWTKLGKGALDWAMKNPQQAASLLGGVGGLIGGAGGSGGGGSTPGAAPGMKPMTAMDFGPARTYNAQAFTPGSAPAPREGHTMGPSSAVNVNDPSSALFGYGTMPTYYSKPTGLAEGGEVGERWPDDEASEYTPSVTPDLHRPPYDERRLPTREEGPMGWITRLLEGDKKTVNQALLGGGALGLIASLLSKRTKNPGFRSIAEMQAGMNPNSASGIPPGYLSNMSAYFNSPASHYVPPPPMLGAVTTGGRGLGLSHGGRPFDSSVQRHVNFGEGGGQDDMVSANLSPGEYVMDADVVSALGDGSNEAGAAALDRMREAIRAHKRSAPADSIPPRAKSPLAYLKTRSK